jgi:hypothetical protein
MPPVDRARSFRRGCCGVRGRRGGAHRLSSTSVSRLICAGWCRMTGCAKWGAVPLSGVERGPCGPLTVFSRVAPRVVAPVRSPRRAVDCGRLLHRRERPAMSREFARDGDDDDRAGLASRLERVPAPMQPPSAALGVGLHGEGFAVASAFERDAPTRRTALVPGGLDQERAYVAVAGRGDPALPAPLPTGCRPSARPP